MSTMNPLEHELFAQSGSPTLFDFKTLDDGKISMRYFDLDDDFVERIEGLTFLNKGRLAPRNDGRGHDMDVETLLSWVWMFRDDETFLNSLIGAISDADTENYLLNHLLQRDPLLKDTLKEQWLNSDESNDDSSADIFSIMCHKGGHVPLGKYIKNEIYSKTWDYFLSDQAAYYIDCDAEIEGLRTDFFDKLMSVAVNNAVVFDDSFPVTIDFDGEVELIELDKIDSTEIHDWVSIDSSHVDSGLSLVFALADILGESDGNVEVRWRHSQNINVFGEVSNMTWQETLEICKEIMQEPVLYLSQLDRHKAKVLASRQTCKRLLDHRNLAVRGEVYELVEKIYSNVYGEVKLEETNVLCGGYLGTPRPEQLFDF
ncbi:hypothetical protein [Enterovibrio norvegicus]|uniref:hypothetical protein n=1 Tax=Enterovibrio norvegicus TaxID=188144 RepID=UPI000C81971B|nr:hypothetical protein [Enterovibrio norvegicus]PMH64466.1 hypothetical protein BCU62_15540 [Enterovibrio norvegicus]